MSDTPEENAAVEQLLAERDALHGWLERLDAASVAASDAVRERVRRDYQQRLDQLTNALREHGDAIAEKLAADQAEHAELSTRTDASRDALAEVELRHAVGEFPHDRFDAERRRHLSDIETFELSLAAVNERVGRMEEVLALVRRAPKAPELPVEEPPADSSPSILEFAPAEAGAPASEELVESIESIEVLETVDEGSIEQFAPDDESDRILSIFGSGEESPAMPIAEPQPQGTATTPEFGPLSFRPSGGAPPKESAPIGMPTDGPPRFVRPGDRFAPATPSWPSVSAATPTADTTVAATPLESTAEPAPNQGIFSEEIVAAGPAPTPAPAAGRTLRCGECGAMNRPLEWYCEKCGAELTAV